MISDTMKRYQDAPFSRTLFKAYFLVLAQSKKDGFEIKASTDTLLNWRDNHGGLTFFKECINKEGLYVADEDLESLFMFTLIKGDMVHADMMSEFTEKHENPKEALYRMIVQVKEDAAKEDQELKHLEDQLK